MKAKAKSYVSGDLVALGDLVQLSSSDIGEVMFVLDTDQYANGFDWEKWEYLQTGFMVRFEGNYMIHYEVAEEDLQLLKRGVD